MRPFHKQDAILFQFVLQELLILGGQINTLKILPKNLTPPQEAVVLSALHHLIGPQTDLLPANWGRKKEVVPKLKQFIKALDIPEARELLHLTQKIEAELIALSEEIGSLSSALKRLKKFMLSVEECVKQLHLSFETNETVLYFYLRKRHLFDAAFSKGFVEALFQEKKGMYEENLLSKFKKRGFFELLPSIEKELSRL